MLKRRELEALREENARLSELIDVLRAIPEAEAQAMLGKLRNTTADLAALLPSGRDRPFVETLPRQVVARLPAQGSLEFELMVRHAVAYPTLAPLDAGGVGFTSLLTCAVARSLADELRYGPCGPISVGGHAYLRLACLRFTTLMMPFAIVRTWGLRRPHRLPVPASIWHTSKARASALLLPLGRSCVIPDWNCWILAPGAKSPSRASEPLS